MGKRGTAIVVSLVLLAAASGRVNGIELVIIPIGYYEKQGNSYWAKAYTSDITSDIALGINKYYSVQIDKTSLNDRLAGVTDMDARRVADYYKVEDVLYGSIKGDGASLAAEVKIYNRRREDYGVFYASDAGNQYERLIKTLVERILDWYRTDTGKVDVLRREVEELRNEVAAVKEGAEKKVGTENAERKEVVKEFALRLPVTAGYWSYINSDWVELVQGTVEGGVGIVMYPAMQFPEAFGMANEVSVGIGLRYRNGLTGSKGEVMMNGIVANPELRYHMNVYTENWVSLGLGIFYEFDVWKIGNIDTKGVQKYSQSLTGYSVGAEYKYRLDPRWMINLGMNVYGYFMKATSPVVRTYIGTDITIVRRPK